MYGADSKCLVFLKVKPPGDVVYVPPEGEGVSMFRNYLQKCVEYYKD